MTQTEKILRHLQEHGEITAYEAVQEYGIMRLAGRVADLKKAGYPIQSRTTRGKNRFGEPVCYSTYYMSN